MKNIITFIAILAIILGVNIYAGDEHSDHQKGKSGVGKTSEAEQKKIIYSCPMHPEVKSDKPGSCPVCGMYLVKKESEDKNSTEHHHYNRKGNYGY